MMKILMITTEAYPFAKTGGLADMVSSLACALKKKNVDVRVFMPRYYCVDRSTLEKFPYLLYVPMPYGDEWADIYKGELPVAENEKSDNGVGGVDANSVPFYFIEHEELYGRDGIYGYTPSKGFTDNSRRYAFLCRSVFHFCRMIDWIPDVFHCHDWGASLVPFILKREESGSQSPFLKCKTMLTIHNLGYQGIFPSSDTVFAGKNIAEWEAEALEFGGAFNFLKAGIVTADIITTVSPTYAKEIQTAVFGHNLDGLLRKRAGDLYGILNGADYTNWNPETDKFIAPANYSAKNISEKQKAKKMLRERFGLPKTPNTPVFGMVTRLAPQKGVVELCYPNFGPLFSICRDMKLQFVIVGSGDKWCEDELEMLSGKLSNLKVWIGHNEELAHLVEAGSDFFLMPSRYEPCGLNQIYSLKYGTLPIVRNTGGLADTVENYNETKGTGTGFIFNDLTPDAIYNTVKWAIYAWENKKRDITKMKKQAMEKDFSWDGSAEEYKKLFTELKNRLY